MKDEPSPCFMTVSQFINELERMLRNREITKEHTVPVEIGRIRLVYTRGSNMAADISFHG